MRVRKVRTRGSGPAGADRQATILRVIDDENRTLAKPFKWTDQGKPLVASTMMLLRPTCTRVCSQTRYTAGL